MVQYGEVSYTTSTDNKGNYSIGTVADFSCVNGLKSGTSSRTCLPSGNWDGQEVTCNPSM